MFKGFESSDFGTSPRGTHWRHRRALGGDLRNHLRRVYGRRYQTWGLPGVNTIHIARRAVYQFPPHQSQAYMFVTAAHMRLVWGLHLPTEGEHWQLFVQRMQQGSTSLAIVLYLLNAYDLTFTDTADIAGGLLGGCWRYEGEGLTWWEACSLPRLALPSDIPFRLSELPQTPASQLSLFAETPSETVVAWKQNTADHLAPVLLGLVPLYELFVAPSV